MDKIIDVSAVDAKKPSIARKLLFLGLIILLSGGLLLGYANYTGQNQSESLIKLNNGLTQPVYRPTPLALNVPVLMYHYIRTVENPDQDKLGVSLSVTSANFERQMAYIAQNGYTTITPDDLWRALNKQAQLPSKPILLTFDDGYVDFYTTAWPILRQYNLKATAYITTGFIGDEQGRYMTWPQIKELDTSGLITIGNHTVNHINMASSPNAWRELTLSNKQLQTYLGHPITSFAYPGGTFNDQAAKLVDSAGFTTAFTTVEGRIHTVSNHLILPRVRISGYMDHSTFMSRVTN